MAIDGKTFSDFHSALLSAFRDRGELRRLVRFGLSANLDEIAASNSDLSDAVFEVIEWADSQGTLRDLGAHAQQANSGNPMLSAFDLGRLLPAPTAEEIADAAPVVTEFKDDVRQAWADLGSTNLAVQIAGAASLRQLLSRPSGGELATIYSGTLANIKVEYPDAVIRELVTVVEAALTQLATPIAGNQKTWLESSSERYDALRLCDGSAPAAGGLSLELDLARARLPRIELPDLDLRGADIAFANLTHSDFTGANLCRARGYGVRLNNARVSRSNLEEARLRRAIAPGCHFHDARMVSVRLEEADLKGAEFHQARLQGAHFNEADLTAAQFQGAQLADADFRQATIDDACARSIIRAFRWRAAKFDPMILGQLMVLAGE